MCSANIVLKIEEALGSTEYTVKTGKDLIELTKHTFYKHELKKVLSILNKSKACKFYSITTTLPYGETLLKIRL